MVDRPGSKFHKFRTASIQRKIDYIFRKEQLIDAFLSEFYVPANGVKAVGIRLAYIQANIHPEVLEWAIKNDVSVVHLVRENSLKTVVSNVTAKKRRLHHATSKVEQVTTVHLPPRKLKRHLTWLTERIKKYRTMLGDKRYLEISYESFVANREAETRRLLDFLNIDQFVPLTTDLVKINPDSLADIIENYAEVKQALSGTAFEKFLD
jgi:LPS sulfotransferase NodH